MLTRWDPFAEMNKLQNELMRRATNGGTMAFRPAVDVMERDDEVVLQAELPGLKKEDVHVNVDDGVLTISGERKFERKRDEEDYHVVERSYGSFSRAFTLPKNIDAQRIDAELKDGLLTVRLPKSEATKPRRIDVKA